MSKAPMKDFAPVMLALIVTVGFFFCIYRTSVTAIPEANRDVYNVMIGVLGTVWVKAMSFFYDSSASSKRKDDTINSMITGTGNGGGNTRHVDATQPEE